MHFHALITLPSFNSGMRPFSPWARVKRPDWRLNPSGRTERRVSLSPSILCLCACHASLYLSQSFSQTASLCQHTPFSLHTVFSLTEALPEFLPTRSSFLRLSWCRWSKTLEPLHFIDVCLYPVNIQQLLDWATVSTLKNHCSVSCLSLHAMARQ